MRVLLTCLPATGHFNSLLPLAEGLTDAGHEVAIGSTSPRDGLAATRLRRIYGYATRLHETPGRVR